MRLLLVDGSNIVMRCAWGGDIAPDQAVPAAAHMIETAAAELEATHLVVAFDCPDEPSWRKREYPEYKAHRKIDTSAWIIAAGADFAGRGWHVEFAPGFEADDVIATIAFRVQKAKAGVDVVVYSNDSDLLQLAAAGVTIAKPLGGGKLIKLTAAEVCDELKIPGAHLAADYKALVGDQSDNIPGVRGVGAVRASQLLQRYPSLDQVIQAGRSKLCKHSALVAENEAAARLALKLVSLHPDVPIAPISPKACALRKARAA